MGNMLIDHSNEQWSIWIVLAFLLIYLTLRKQIDKNYLFESLLGHENNGQ